MNSAVGFHRDLVPFSAPIIEKSLSAPNSLNLQRHTNPVRASRLKPLVQRQASETLFNLGDVVSSKAGTIQDVVKRSFYSLEQPLPVIATTTRDAAIEFLRKSWWTFPMILALLPFYCLFFKGVCATMPDWWQVVKIDTHNTPFSVGCFLFSNASYFLAGSYLLTRFPFQRKGKVYQPTRFSMLGVWILVAGLVSVIFHSVQTVGSYALAESLCYIDHGIAISSGFYYFDTCGFPSRCTLGLGLAGLAALVFTYPGYVWLHSSWHLLSAAAATRWALEGHDRTLSKNEVEKNNFFS